MKVMLAERRKILCTKSAVAAVAFMVLTPFGVYAKTVTPPKPIPVQVAGWVPYWRTATGTADAIAHMDAFKEISPFGYTVRSDGTLFDAMHVDDAPWQALIKAAHDKKVKVVPTVMWSNAEAIDATLRSPKLRKAHINAIVKAIWANGFDGVDIDYEGKKAATKKYFSFFLRDLYKAIGQKLVSCTIEARTPLDSRYDTIPKDIQYANDFVSINQYCDRVRIMAYDQGTIDLQLTRSAAGNPYIPVADTKWVEKVIRLASKTISKKKIMIGVPTYGYEYETTPLTQGYRYDLLWAFNPKYATNLAGELGIIPVRNSAGELSFSYRPTTTTATPPSSSVAASNSNLLGASLIPIAAPVVASTTVAQTPTAPLRIVWWSDATAIRDKVVLAQKLGVRGIAIFKIDGGEDPEIWNVLK